MKQQHYIYNTQSVFTVILLSLVILSTELRSEVTTGTDEVAQLPYWEWRDEVASVRLVQRLPDQSRGFFEARGFTKEHADLIAQSCVFQTVYKNIAEAGSKHVIDYDLSQWRLIVNGEHRQMKLREDWEKQWDKLGVSKKAKIAFKWSLLPTKQTYKAQDYNWGMSVYNLKPGTRFDLIMTWTVNGKPVTVTLNNLECAPDVYLEPKNPFG